MLAEIGAWVLGWCCGGRWEVFGRWMDSEGEAAWMGFVG